MHSLLSPTALSHPHLDPINRSLSFSGVYTLETCADSNTTATATAWPTYMYLTLSIYNLYSKITLSSPLNIFIALLWSSAWYNFQGNFWAFCLIHWWWGIFVTLLLHCAVFLGSTSSFQPSHRHWLRTMCDRVCVTLSQVIRPKRIKYDQNYRLLSESFLKQKRQEYCPLYLHNTPDHVIKQDVYAFQSIASQLTVPL